MICHREYEREERSSPADMNFDGGLTIPGSIWHRLYRYVNMSTCMHTDGQTVSFVTLLSCIMQEYNLDC